MDLARSQFIAKSLAIFNLFLSNEQIQRDFLEGRNNAVVCCTVSLVIAQLGPECCLTSVQEYLTRLFYIACN